MTKYDKLCLRAMDDLGITPEEFGQLMYDACERPNFLDDVERKREKRDAKRQILSLEYGFELIKLGR